MKPGQLLQPPHCAQQMGSLFPLTTSSGGPRADHGRKQVAGGEMETRWKRGIDSERPITEATGLLCWRDFHPQEWQLASLHQILPGGLSAGALGCNPKALRRSRELALPL